MSRRDARRTRRGLACWVVGLYRQKLLLGREDPLDRRAVNVGWLSHRCVDSESGLVFVHSDWPQGREHPPGHDVEPKCYVRIVKSATVNQRACVDDPLALKRSLEFVGIRQSIPGAGRVRAGALAVDAKDDAVLAGIDPPVAVVASTQEVLAGAEGDAQAHEH